MDLNTLHAKIIDAVLNNPYGIDECERFRFEDDSGIIYRQGVVRLDDGISIVFSLPSKAAHIYILANEGDENLLRGILANIEEAENEYEIRLGNVLLLNSSELVKRNIAGVIFLPIDVSRILNYLPEKLTVEKKDYSFYLVVFLSDIEHEIWKSFGHDALMDHFSRSEKDLLAFGDIKKPAN